jgi:hypothetical protein
MKKLIDKISFKIYALCVTLIYIITSIFTFKK